MSVIKHTPFIWAEFDKRGKLIDPSILSDYSAFLKDKSDILIVSHGWKTDQDEAWKSYNALWSHLEAMVGIAPKKWGVVGISWPSTKYRTEIDSLADPVSNGSGGAVAAAAASGGIVDISEQELIDQVLAFAQFAGTDAGKLLTAVKKIEKDGITMTSAAALLEALDGAVGFTRPGDDELLRDARPLLTANPMGLLFAAQAPVQYGVTEGGQTSGIGTAIKKWIAGPLAGIANILEFTTYWEMKKRAGRVGAALGQMLVQPNLSRSRRFHLVGHSFGGRLATAAASALATGSKIETLVLMQAAFSHNGLTASFKPGTNGAFSNVVSDTRAKRIAITHTHNDRACRIAYPIASRLSQDIVANFGGIDDEYGAMGANGARKLPDAVHARVISKADGIAPLGPKLVNSIECSAHIKDHNDVWTQEMATLIKNLM